MYTHTSSMLSITPLSLLCALLMCLPLAIVFTINTTPITTTPPSSSSCSTTTTKNTRPTTTTTTTTTKNTRPTTTTTITTTKATINDIPLTTILISTSNNNNNNATAKIHHKQPTATTTNSTASPPPPPPSPPPPIQVDYEEDELLLRVASRVNPRPKRPRKVAFMFLTTAALPFAPLWQLYFNATPLSHYNIYIHADPLSLSNYNATSTPFHGVFARRVIPSKPTRRFTPTLVSAARRLLSHALLHDASNSHFALLSGSCIPLHSFNFTYKTVISSRKSFIEILENETGSYDRWAARGEDAMWPEVTLEKFRIGSQFWVLTRKHAKAVVSDRGLWSKFKQPCLRYDTCYPEENYFPTLMNMVDPVECVPATLTHVDWSGRHDGHPRTYGANEVGEELIERLRSERPRYGDEEESSSNGSDSTVRKRHHPFLFARKFSPKSLKPLMSIASEFIFKD